MKNTHVESQMKRMDTLRKRRVALKAHQHMPQVLKTLEAARDELRGWLGGGSLSTIETYDEVCATITKIKDDCNV